MRILTALLVGVVLFAFAAPAEGGHRRVKHRHGYRHHRRSEVRVRVVPRDVKVDVRGWCANGVCRVR